MRDTGFPDEQRRCATSYEPGKEGQMAVRSDLTFPAYVHAAGGLCSSLDDLIVWDQALASGKVIPAELADLAWSPARLSDGSIARVGGTLSYGLGWAIDTTPNHRWVGHSGGNSTAFRRYLDDRMTIVILHNGASDPDAIANSVARAMLEDGSAGGVQANLWDAASGGDQQGVEAALKAGADINALDTRSSRNGRYALNWAAFKGHAAIVGLLLQNGARIDAQNLSGFTALHHAAEGGSAPAAQVLLQAGADTSLRTGDGETASDVARRKGHAALAQSIDAAPQKSK